MKHVVTGLEQLLKTQNYQDLVKGKIGYLCHGASITKNYVSGIEELVKLFGVRLIKLFGPQHGIRGDVQDNMIESENFLHPYFGLPVYSLYSDTRSPNQEMLNELDTIIVDLQDVGTRVYTYISTLNLLLKECQDKDIRVVILDRPNPIGGNVIEGNILEEEFKSFVGPFEIPMRHALTMGEVGLFAQKYYYPDVDLKVIPLIGWNRSMYFDETGLPWVNPSPNLPTFEGSWVYPGSVLFEGTNISEGRGTTRSLEIVGFPELEPFELRDKLEAVLKKFEIEGVILRPIEFIPTFQKHHGKLCGGLQIHPIDKKEFRPWRLGQVLCQYLYHNLDGKFEWNTKPYEYEFERPAIDMINGTDKIRHWVERNKEYSSLCKIEQHGIEKYTDKISNILIY